MKLSRPLRYALIATVCASLYVAWMDRSSTAPESFASASARGTPEVTATAGGTVKPASANTPQVAQVAQAENSNVDLFAAPGWRLGAMVPSGGLPDDAGLPLDAMPRKPAPAVIEASAIWRDARGVMVVLTRGESERIACRACTAPGRLRPGERWDGYRLDAVDGSGATVTELSTGRRIRLGVPT